jgi:hypothetical protein
MADERTVAEIEDDLAEARQRLADNLSRLVAAVHPRAVTHRAVVDAKHQAIRAVDVGVTQVRRSYDLVSKQFKDEAGWNRRTLAITGAGLAGLVIIIAMIAKKK